MEIRRLQRVVHNTSFVIYIEKNLYNNNCRLFDCLFSTYSLYDHPCEHENVMFILPSKSDHSAIDYSKNRIICDTSDKKWGLRLIGALEEWYATILDCTVIHGSCLQLNNRSILIVGKRKSGKTTLTGYLTLNKGATYLDDDCIYIINDNYYGFNMPISIRLNVDNLFEERVIDEFYDVENVKRKLFQPSRVMAETANVSIVIFPYYNDRGINQITPINNSNFYNRILSNVRHSRDPESIFKDVSFLIKNASAYQIAYTNSEKAYKLLKTIVYNKGKI